jgi:Family of unknown function (DUF6085)
MGCGETLFLGAGDYITCAELTCPRPDAVADILDDGEPQHIVQIVDETGFTVRHPLRERLDDDLMRCDLHAWIAAQAVPPALPGRYRVMWAGDPPPGVWTWWSRIEEVTQGD